MKKLLSLLFVPALAFAQANIGQPAGITASSVAAGGGGGGVSIASSTGNLTVSPSPLTGTGTIDLNLGNANTWTAAQTFTNSDIRLLGSSTGYTTFTSANASGTNYTITFPAATATLATTANYTNSITYSGGFELVGDSSSPGNSYFYGTNGSGTKSWYAQSTITAGLTGGTNTQVIYFTGSSSYGSNSGFTSDTSGNVTVHSLSTPSVLSASATAIGIQPGTSGVLNLGTTSTGAVNIGNGTGNLNLEGAVITLFSSDTISTYAGNLSIYTGSAANAFALGQGSNTTIYMSPNNGVTIGGTSDAGFNNLLVVGDVTTAGITMGSGTGTVTAASGVFSVTSDMRAKNPQGQFTTGLSAILKLHPVVYDFKSDKAHQARAGFYTQDVEPVIPHAVFHDDPSGMASLDDRPILAASVNAIKELAARPGTLEIRCFEGIALLALGLSLRRRK